MYKNPQQIKRKVTTDKNNEDKPGDKPDNRVVVVER